MVSTSSPPTEKNLGLTTLMNSGLRIEKSEINIGNFSPLTFAPAGQLLIDNLGKVI